MFYRFSPDQYLGLFISARFRGQLRQRTNPIAFRATPSLRRLHNVRTFCRLHFDMTSRMR